MKNIKFLIRASAIGAIYASLTLLLMPYSYGMMQVRVAEALTILPFFTSAAIPGLFIGCLISNIMGGYGLLDIVFGSMATLLAAVITYKMKRKLFAPLPPVILNALIVGGFLSYILGTKLFVTMAWVGLGQFIACYGLGYPLMKALEKYKEILFK